MRHTAKSTVSAGVASQPATIFSADSKKESAVQAEARKRAEDHRGSQPFRVSEAANKEEEPKLICKMQRLDN